MEIPALLELEVSETYSLTLPGLATAGYQWTYEITQIDDSVVDVSALPFEEKGLDRELASVRIGSSQDETFHIRALKAGNASLRFVQRRSWEQDRPPLKEYQIEIVVRE